MGRIFSFTEAKRNLSQVLDAAEQDGEARIVRRDGKVFEVLPEHDTIVLLITRLGILVERSGQQFLIPFEQYPQLTKATVEQVFRGRLIGSRHLRFDELDIDIDLLSASHPEQFPLKFNE